MNTSLSYFILGAYLPLGNLRYIFATLILSIYILILFLNFFLIGLIAWKPCLHEPSQLFLCSLFLNEIYGSTGLLTFLLHQTLQDDVHTVSAVHCFLQIFCVYSYATVEVLSLAAMSYDRYLAICLPLQYRTLMTLNKAASLVGLIWIYSFIRCAITISLTLSLTFCSNQIDHLFCHNFLIVRLACFDTQMNNIYGFFAMSLSLLIPLLPILFSYGHILRVALSCPERGWKAVHTCTPHIVSLLNFALGSFFEIMQTRFPESGIPVLVRISFPIYFYTLQPLLNPIMYGMKTSSVRAACKDTTRKIVHRFNAGYKHLCITQNLT